MRRVLLALPFPNVSIAAPRALPVSSVLTSKKSFSVAFPARPLSVLLTSVTSLGEFVFQQALEVIYPLRFFPP